MDAKTTKWIEENGADMLKCLKTIERFRHMLPASEFGEAAADYLDNMIDLPPAKHEKSYSGGATLSVRIDLNHVSAKSIKEAKAKIKKAIANAQKTLALDRPLLWIGRAVKLNLETLDILEWEQY